MTAPTLRLVTIIAETVLEERLVRDVKRLGARGYTLTPARGSGTRPTDADWDGGRIRLETVVAPEVARAILDLLSAEYFADYAVIAFAHDVEVVRSDKYV